MFEKTILENNANNGIKVTWSFSTLHSLYYASNMHVGLLSVVILTVWFFGLPKWWSWEICSSRMLCSQTGSLFWSVSRPCTSLIFEGHWFEHWATNTQWLSTVLQKIWISKFLTVCWPSNGTTCSQYFTVIHYTFPPWLPVRNSSTATLFSARVFSIIFFSQNFHENVSVFRPSLLFPTHTVWYRIYTKLGEFHINTVLYVENCKNLSEVGHSSKVARHRITSTNLSMFCDDSMRSVNPL